MSGGYSTRCPVRREMEVPMTLGDAEHPISFAFEPRAEGVHVRVVVRAGLRGSRALAGELTFRPEEWAAFREGVRAGEFD